MTVQAMRSRAQNVVNADTRGNHLRLAQRSLAKDVVVLCDEIGRLRKIEAAVRGVRDGLARTDAEEIFSDEAEAS
jgi:stage III sporulation protein SpoIIIAA